ncbi:MAG TPA: VOC family protein [Bradyrhizobium sp.]|nr:VOC family protein [Bradyrhizobium sp.]
MPRGTRRLLLIAGALAAAHVGESRADLGPCRLAAPTTPGVMVVVSDVERAANWYRDQTGLTETARRVDPSLSNAVLIDMARGTAGVTLIESSFAPSASLPQIVCLVLDGPPAPPVGSEPRYLTDPDGTSVELPARPK